jgi:hypothetical protein
LLKPTDGTKRKSRTWGLEFIERVEEAILKIAENPLSHGKVIEDARRVLLNQFPYALWYVVADDSVVIGCLHGKRDLSLARTRFTGLTTKPKDPSPS